MPGMHLPARTFRQCVCGNSPRSDWWKKADRDYAQGKLYAIRAPEAQLKSVREIYLSLKTNNNKQKNKNNRSF